MHPAHSRETIAAAALALIDKKGIEAFSTRQLAARLGLKVMSLYHYFPSREALLDAAVDRMLAELVIPAVGQIGWREGLLLLAQEYRDMGHRHLLAIPLLAQRFPLSVTMQRFLDTLSGLLVKAGLSPHSAAAWLVIQRDYVVGSLLADHSAFIQSRESPVRHTSQASREIVRNRAVIARRMREEAFLKGFNALLEGIAREC